MNRDRIREIFMAHGFKIKDGKTDLKPYVYEAAEALIKEVVRSVHTSRCNTDLQALGKPMPRTCAECGLGPCKVYAAGRVHG